MMDKEFLFVYGTLRQGFVNPVRAKMEKYAGYPVPAVMQGKLFEIGHYPGAVLSDNPDELVHGDLYTIKDRKKLFAILDKYEESSDDFPAPREYIRKKISVTLSNGHKVIAWAYLYNRETSDKIRIPSGDYLNPNQ